MKKALVLLSGGMDSVTALYYARSIDYECTCISFDYGSKHNEKERAAAVKVCEELSTPFYMYDLPTTVAIKDKEFNLCMNLVPLLCSNLLTSGGEIPEGHYEAESMKDTVVPFRNGIMLALAVGFAESRDINTIILGNHAGDHAIYPDCRKEFTEAFAESVRLGTSKGIELFTPFVAWTKSDICNWGLDYGVLYENTWTCYNGQGDRPCLKCGTCVERTEAFLDGGRPDPLLTLEEWDAAVKIYNEVMKNE